MGSLPRVSVTSGARVSVQAAPLPDRLQCRSADRTALLYSDETCSVRVSYAELDGRTNAMGRAIATHARPAGPNRDRDYVIAVCMQPSHNTILALLATWKAGAAYVPLDPSFPQARVSHILGDAQPSLIIYDDTVNPSTFASSGVAAISFEELSLEASSLPADRPSDTEVLAQNTVDTIAIILYTSGSTGIPKGVRLPYSAICNRLWWQFRTFPFSDTESTCVWKTALTFVDAVSEIWGPLLHGRTLLILSKETTRNPQKLVQVLAENQVERLVLVPTLLQSILMCLSLNRSERPLRRLKLWVCSGETLSKELAARFFQYFGDHDGFKLANFYGSTEVMGDVTYYVMEKFSQIDLFPTIPIGRPVDNCAVFLLDEEMNPSRESDTGEVWVAGQNLARGYVGGQAPEKFCDNPHASHPDYSRLYRTGDYGILYKGVILYAGRTDSQIKIRGHRVDLQEVERAVAAIQGVEKGVVLCYGLQYGNPEILAFVKLGPNVRLNGQRIESALKEVLTNYMIPQVIIIESIPLLVNDDTIISLDYDYSDVHPENIEAARALFETVGEVLGRSARGAISLSAGFYELGGNSLNSIFTITKLREKGFYIVTFLAHQVLEKCCVICQPHLKVRRSHPNLIMIVSSFYEKAELEQFLRSEIHVRDYARCIDACWQPLLLADLSVVLENNEGTPVAVALNFDARDEPDIELAGGLAKIMTFLEFVRFSTRL
ncbi:unnamed protein product [Leptidea sinapis]|uniref:AMP-dependent synthetase/ligase domain-containing protein n=1 Tax=Leptidea sinapis TaxID=189913 RepID=A0A5E4R8T5_9NEOP|nr:unnamed protein product [Leptidea sinapis]